VTLRDEDGTPLAEVAERLGVKYMALYSHYRRGKRGHELAAALTAEPSK
jgi:AcrR family transcriptional regulator